MWEKTPQAAQWSNYSQFLRKLPRGFRRDRRPRIPGPHDRRRLMKDLCAPLSEDGEMRLLGDKNELLLNQRWKRIDSFPDWVINLHRIFIFGDYPHCISQQDYDTWNDERRTKEARAKLIASPSLSVLIKLAGVPHVGCECVETT